ncbi:MAG: beta-propeller domain-containing protein [Akkermansiaceae bacterium]|nr:beta-propeller domain-containing protein [Akkermansiaceae bacterium]
MKSHSLLALAVLAMALIGAPARAEGDFSPLAADRLDRAVLMKLPDGVRRIRLRVKTEDGAWKTCTVAHLEGNEGYLKLRLPDQVAADDLEVSASWTDPFPYSFYQGAADHQSTESDGGVVAGPMGPLTRDDALTDSTGTEPAVEESDIWKWRGSTLYFFNQYRGLQVIDVSDPAVPQRLASQRVNANGEQMYLHPAQDLVILLTYDPGTDAGKVVLVAHESPHVLQQRASFPVPGYILESRMVGNILYVVSRKSWQESFVDPDAVTHVTWRSGLAITKIDLSDPAKPLAAPPLTLAGDPQYNYWGAQVQATSKALLIATTAYDSLRQQSVSTLHVVDISEPASPPIVTHHLAVQGQIINKFNMNLQGSLLTAVSQVWRGSPNRQRFASVETFDLSRSSPRLAALEFASNESITATRFVGDLLYVVTFLRVDPLFVISLADPARPTLLSELVVPGFSTYLAPLGEDSLISIGVEGPQIAVSWFDVSDPTAPSLASRVLIGAEDGWSWTEANWDEKALGFFPDDNLLLVPFQGSVPGAGWMSGVQLVELGDHKLVERGSFEHEFQARRARVLDGAVVSISGRSLKSLDITDRDHPRLLAELSLAWPVDIVHRVGEVFIQLDRGAGGYWDGGTNAPAYLHASPIDDPDALLASLELPGGRIAGSFLHGDCLYVAQPQTTQEPVKDGVEFAETFTTTVIDLSDPGRPVIAGRASRTTPPAAYFYGFGSDYRGALLPDGSLVWYPSEPNNYYWRGPMPLSPLLDFDRGIPYYPSSSRVYTVDIADKARPAILAVADLATTEGAWPEGEIQLLGAILYHGLQQSETLVQPDGSTKWFSQHLLGRLDLSDPTAPVAGDLVKLPGTFEYALGTPTRGTNLFTTSQRSYMAADNTWRNELRVQALAFDGLQAFLISELVVPNWGYGPKVFDDRFLVLGKTAYAADGGSRTGLTIYEWQGTGSFLELHTLKRPTSVYRIGVVDHLLVALGSELTFFDFVDPADPDPASAAFPGVDFWQSLDLIEIDGRRQAHLPVGFHGVRTLDFGGVFPPSTPVPPPGFSNDPRPEWQTIALAKLAATSGTAGLALAPLAAGQDWNFASGVEPMGYEDWTRLALGLAAAEPVPAPALDSDLDGRSNLWEYFTGTDPGDPRQAASIQLQLTTAADAERHLTGFLAINPHAAALLTITPEVSFDLEHWDGSPEMIELVAEPFSPGVVLRLTEPVRNHRAAFLRAALSIEP